MTLLNIVNLTIVFFIVITVLMNVYITNKTSNISHQKIDLINPSRADLKPLMYRLYYKYRDSNEPYFHILDEIMLSYDSESFSRPIDTPKSNNFSNYIKFSINENILNMYIFIPSKNIDDKYGIHLNKNFKDLTLSEFIDQTSSSLYNYLAITVENIDVIAKLHNYDIEMSYGLSIKNKLLITEDEYNIIMMERMLNNGQKD